MIVTTLIVVVLSGCAGQIRGLDDTLTPLARFRVAIPQAQLSTLPEEVRQRLRVGILWAGINLPSSWCAEQLSDILTPTSPQSAETPEKEDERAPEESPPDPDEPPDTFTPESVERLFQLLEICPDPFGVAPALGGPSTPLSQGVERNGRLEVDIIFTALPPAEVIIGTPDARVAYGSVVIFDDLNEDEVLTVGFALPFGLEKGSAESDQGDNDARGRGFFDDPIEPDLLYGSSFTTLLDTQQRIVFREGNFVESFFYPLGDCVPPPGLSIMTIAPEEPGDFEDLKCDIQEIDESLILEVSGPNSRLQELICDPPEVWVLRAGDDLLITEEDLDRSELTCLSPWELVISNTDASCKTLSVFRLIDCPSDEPTCENPWWDDRAQPPVWWPCGEQL